MKKIVIFTLSLFWTLSLFSQKQDEIRELSTTQSSTCHSLGTLGAIL